MHKVVHVRPVDDMIGHEESAFCVCGPVGRQAPSDLGLIFQHHALLPCHEWETSSQAE